MTPEQQARGRELVGELEELTRHAADDADGNYLIMIRSTAVPDPGVPGRTEVLWTWEWFWRPLTDQQT